VSSPGAPFLARASRGLGLVGSIALLVAGAVHAIGYVTTSIAIANSGLKPEIQQTFRTLWFGYLLQLVVIAGVLLVAALRAGSVAKSVVLILALLPLLNATLLFTYGVSTAAASLMGLGSVLVLIGAIAHPGAARRALR
jgi:hypothetical protein